MAALSQHWSPVWLYIGTNVSVRFLSSSVTSFGGALTPSPLCSQERQLAVFLVYRTGSGVDWATGLSV